MGGNETRGYTHKIRQIVTTKSESYYSIQHFTPGLIHVQFKHCLAEKGKEKHILFVSVNISRIKKCKVRIYAAINECACLPV